MLDQLAVGRQAYRQQAWGDAYEAFAHVDQAGSLGREDLEQLATAAYLNGREAAALRAFERAYRAYLKGRQKASAARCAFWVGLLLMLRAEPGRSAGWLSRAQRLLDQACEQVEHGYLQLPRAERSLSAGDPMAAYAAATSAAALGERFSEADLTACAQHLQGRALLLQGKQAEGIAVLDEAMASVTAGELTPLMTGLIYCSVIDACCEVYAWDRAREWTCAMASWCATQPQMLAFRGTCLVHRAEVFQRQGDWERALTEAHNACAQSSLGVEQRPSAAAFYQQGEVHRLRGEFAAAERAYRKANLAGSEPQPGLSLLRVAQERSAAGAATLRRVMASTLNPQQRARLLPAFVEILLAAGEPEEARTACLELEQLAQRFDTEMLRALAAQARGSVQLMEGDAQGAIASLRRAGKVWQDFGAPYLGARVRELLGRAYRALADEDGEALELDAARASFAQLGAAPDVARIDALRRHTSKGGTRGLTTRELQVLSLVAAGKTNKTIAGELSISVKTVARHVDNIFTKIDVTSRAAATAYAYEHHLL